MLLIIGLLLSMPMIIFGSSVLLHVMERFPILVTAGAALLGWIAGELAVSDPLLHGWLGHGALLGAPFVPALGAALVVTSGYLWAAWRRRVQPVETGSGGR